VLSRVIELHFLIMFDVRLQFRNLLCQQNFSLARSYVCPFQIVLTNNFRQRVGDLLRQLRIRVPVFDHHQICANDRFDAFISDDGVFIRFKLGQLLSSPELVLQFILANDIQIA